MTRQILSNFPPTSSYGYDPAPPHHYTRPNYALQIRSNPRSDPMTSSRAQPRTNINAHPHPLPSSTPQSTRRRIPVACARCRKRKIRCSGDPGDNSGCVNCKQASIAPGLCMFQRVNSTEIPTATVTYASTSSYPSLPRYSAPEQSLLLPQQQTAAQDYTVAAATAAYPPAQAAQAHDEYMRWGSAPAPRTYGGYGGMGETADAGWGFAGLGAEKLPVPKEWKGGYQPSERSGSSEYSSASSSYVHVSAVGMGYASGGGEGQQSGERRPSKVY